MKCGIVGLPNVGKSTLFNCLSSAKAQAANYPFCTIEPNVGQVTVPDHRLERLSELVQNVIFKQDVSPKAAADKQKNLKTHFPNLECHFPPGFFAEGRRGLAKQLVNSHIDSYINPYIYI